MRAIGLLLAMAGSPLALGAGYTITEVPLTPAPAGVTIPSTASGAGRCVAVNEAGVAACNTVYTWKQKVGRWVRHYQRDYAATYGRGVLTPLPPVTGDTDTRATAINSAGQVAGLSAYNLAIQKATVWTSGVSAAFEYGNAIAINDLGVVVVEGADSGKLYDLATGQWSVPAYATNITRINNAGASIGWFNFQPGSSEDQGFTRSSAGPDDPQFILRGSMPSYSDINSTGVVVATLTWSTEPSQGFVSRPGEPTRGLEPYGAPSTTALAINDNGAIAGSYGGRAVVWDAGLRTDLTDALGDSSWVLTFAYDINNSGVVVGEGLHNGLRRGFLLTTPLGTTTSPEPVPTPTPEPTPEPTPPPPSGQACTGTGTLELRGFVEDDDGALSDVVLSLSGPDGCSATALTTSDGKYSFPALATGSYTLVPAKTGCSFSPSADTRLLTETTDVDFGATCL